MSGTLYTMQLLYYNEDALYPWATRALSFAAPYMQKKVVQQTHLTRRTKDGTGFKSFTSRSFLLFLLLCVHLRMI